LVRPLFQKLRNLNNLNKIASYVHTYVCVHVVMLEFKLHLVEFRSPVNDLGLSFNKYTYVLICGCTCAYIYMCIYVCNIHVYSQLL